MYGMSDLLDYVGPFACHHNLQLAHECCLSKTLVRVLCKAILAQNRETVNILLRVF